MSACFSFASSLINLIYSKQLFLLYNLQVLKYTRKGNQHTSLLSRRHKYNEKSWLGANVIKLSMAVSYAFS
jgi:hypothetical protein